MNTEALTSFVKVAEMRSLSAAARLYGLPKSTLSLHVKQLGADLNVELFERSGRSMLLTDAGRTLLAHARQILGSCDAARAALTELSDDVAGTLRIGATGEFGTAFYAQMMIAFRRLYPKVEIELTFFSPHVLYASESFDQLDAVVSWDEGETEGETLWTARFALFASRSYLDRAGTPRRPSDLADHQGIVYRTPAGLQHWRLQKGAAQESILPRSSLIANEYWTVKYFAAAGEGIAYLPRFFTDIECERGHLVPLLADWESAEKRVSIRLTRPQAASRKMAAFMDTCRRYFSPGFEFEGPRYFVETIHDPQRPEQGTRP